jgi:hypothetical protein
MKDSFTVETAILAKEKGYPQVYTGCTINGYYVKNVDTYLQDTQAKLQL